MNAPPAISFRLLSRDEFEVIRPLWEQLNQHHAVLPTPFASEIAARTFESRLLVFRQKPALFCLRVEIACITPDMSPVAYCVASLSPDRVGEVDSLYVSPSYRRMGIASTLMQGALEWLRESDAISQRVVIFHANDEAAAFYRRFGFLPRNIEFELSPPAV